MRRYLGEPCKHCGNEIRYTSNSACVSCTASRREIYIRTPEAREKRREHGKTMEGRAYLYNLSGAQLQAIFDLQNGKCSICSRALGEVKRWTVDHNHSCCPTKGSCCGKCVRGLLCARCNTAIGLLGDDENLLQTASKYVVSKLPAEMTKYTGYVMPPPAPLPLRRANPRRKLDAFKVQEIRKQISEGLSKHEVAKSFGIGTHQVMNVVHRRVWKHVP